MPFAVKCGLARVTCFVGSPACASGFVTAQEIVSANKPGDDGAVILTRPPVMKAFYTTCPGSLSWNRTT
jgi:hypothetical protein